MRAVEENEKYLFWEEQIEKWQASGLSQPAYCEANSLKLSTFSYYRHRFLKSSSSGPVNFVSVNPKSNYSSAANIQLMLPNGIRVIVSSEATESLLKMVLNIAWQVSC